MAETVKQEEKKSRGFGPARWLAQIMTSPLVGRMQLGYRSGLTFGGKRDLYKVFGYDNVLFYNKYIARYQRDGIATRIVNAYPQATWRNPPHVYDTDDDLRDSPFEKAWDDLNKRFKLFPLFERLDILAGLGEYAIIFIGAPGSLNGDIGKLSSPDRLLYLSPYGQGAAAFGTIDPNPSSPRFGKPSMYKIGGTDVTHLTFQLPAPGPIMDVHYSRIFHVAEGILEGSLFGKPRLESVWNYLDDLAKVVGGSAEMYWLAGNRGIAFEVDPNTEVDDPDEFKAETEEYIHGMSRALRLQGAKVHELGTTVADPSGNFSTIISCIAGSTGIPQRILMGSEAGQLASTQDRDNWNERIIERRTAFAEPVILLPFIDRMIELGVLPEPANDGVKCDWPDLMAYSAEQKSVQALRESTALSNLANATSKGVQVPVSEKEVRKRWFGLAPMNPGDGIPIIAPVVSKNGNNPNDPSMSDGGDPNANVNGSIP